MDEKVLEFALEDILETCSIKTMDNVVKQNVEYALREQLGIKGNVVILPACQNVTYKDGFYTVEALFEVFADDGNTIIAKGTVVSTFMVLDEKVFEDYSVEGLELLRIDGSILRALEL